MSVFFFYHAGFGAIELWYFKLGNWETVKCNSHTNLDLYIKMFKKKTLASLSQFAFHITIIYENPKVPRNWIDWHL